MPRLNITDDTPFSRILEQGIRMGHIPARTQEARKWFRERARGVSTTAETVIKMSKARRRNVRPVIGRAYLWQYDPKHKDKLPYYDTFPCGFIINKYPDGFLAINLHYLSLPWRAILLDALMRLKTNKKFDESTKLRISYAVLNRMATMRYFRPCVKRYLYSHIRMTPVQIYSAEWDVGLFLPIARFKKAQQTRVWLDSEKAIRAANQR